MSKSKRKILPTNLSNSHYLALLGSSLDPQIVEFLLDSPKLATLSI
jgi:hypothetical protein